MRELQSTINGVDYGCMMIPLPEPLLTEIDGYSMCVPSEFVIPDKYGDGKHVTLLYGVLTDDPNEIANTLRKVGFKNIEHKTCFEIKRESGQKFTVFLLAAQK